MNRVIRFVALVLVALSGCRSSSAAPSLNTLRTIKVERQTLLTLGTKMPESANFCDWIGETCTLKPGSFGGTKTMSLTKTGSGLISQFHFDYGLISTESVNAQVEGYTRTLGKPSKDSIRKQGDVDVREVEWSDSVTTFQLFYKMCGTQVEASALLFDNALVAPVH